MTNTAVAVQHAVTCICSNETGKNYIEIVDNIFKNLGHTMIIERKNIASCYSNFCKWNSFLDETY